jgi:alpha-1,2-mannosyltransferase
VAPDLSDDYGEDDRSDDPRHDRADDEAASQLQDELALFGFGRFGLFDGHRPSKIAPWALAGLSGACALGLAIYLALRSYQVDIDVYRMGGRHVFGSDLYSVHFGGLFFTYTPFAALAFALPSVLFAISTVQRIWAVTNVVALTAVIYLSIRGVVHGVDRKVLLRCSLLLLLPAIVLDPVFVDVGLGQINLVLCALILWDLTTERRVGSRTVPQGIASGMAAAIKLTPLIFVAYMLVTKRWKGALWGAATFVAAQVLAFAVSPRASREYWSKYVLDSKRAGALLYVSDQNLSSVLERLGHGPVSDAVLVPLLVAIGMSGMALAVWAHRRSSPMLGILVCATTGLVISPITWVHHMVWIVPALIWLLFGADRPRRGTLLAAVTALLFVVAPIWWVPTSWRPSTLAAGPPELHENAWQLVAANSFFFAMALFLVGVACMLFVRARSLRIQLRDLEVGLRDASSEPFYDNVPM